MSYTTYVGKFYMYGWNSSCRLFTHIFWAACIYVSNVAFHPIFLIHSHWGDSLLLFSFNIDLYEAASFITQILLPLAFFIKVYYANLTFGVTK